MANRNPHNRIIPEEGTKFQFWTVGTEYESRKNFLYLKCRCICGKWKFVRAASLRLGHSKSCGCIKESHRLRSHPLYSTWSGMRSRCNDSNNKQFKTYGGRGIKVCQKWNDPLNGIAAFIKDMGEKPSDKHSLDRIDNDGDYESSNCRWATTDEQTMNRSNSIHTKTKYNNWACTGNEKSIERGKYGKRRILEVICEPCGKTYWRSKWNITSGRSKQCRSCGNIEYRAKKLKTSR